MSEQETNKKALDAMDEATAAHLRGEETEWEKRLADAREGNPKKSEKFTTGASRVERFRDREAKKQVLPPSDIKSAKSTVDPKPKPRWRDRERTKRIRDGQARRHAEELLRSRPKMEILDGLELLIEYPAAARRFGKEAVGRIFPNGYETPLKLIGEPIFIQVVQIVRSHPQFDAWDRGGLNDREFALPLYRDLRGRWIAARQELPVVLYGPWEGLCEAEIEALASRPTDDPEGRLLPGMRHKD